MSNISKDDYICHGPLKNDGYGYDLRLSDGSPAFRLKNGKAGNFSNAFPESKENTGHLYPYKK